MYLQILQYIAIGSLLISISCAIVLPNPRFVSDFAKNHHLANVVLHVADDMPKSDIMKW